jgi:hypothetical protein
MMTGLTKQMLNSIFLVIIIPITCFSQSTKPKYVSEVLINGKIAWFNTGQTEILKTLGKPDSIIYNSAPCARQFDVEDSLVYFRKIVFEKNKDTLAFSRMDFSEDGRDFVQFDKIRLTSKTTIEQLQQNYSNNNDRSSEEVDDYETGKKVRILDLEVGPTNNDYQKWYLIFYEGKLIRLEMWVAC